MESDKANCSFCGRHNTSVQVICELKCLICAICLKSKCIRGLLIDAIRPNGSCVCPICDHLMAPNMAIYVKEFSGNQSLAEHDLSKETARNLLESLNPFALYYSKSLELIGFDVTSSSKSLLTSENKTALQRCNSLLSGVEDTIANRLTSVGVLEFMVDIYCLLWDRQLRGAALESEPFYDIVTSNGEFVLLRTNSMLDLILTNVASAQKKKWGSANDPDDTSAIPPGSALATQMIDTDNMLLALQGRSTRLGKFKSLVDALLSQLSFQVQSSGNKAALAMGKSSLRTSFTSHKVSVRSSVSTRPSTANSTTSNNQRGVNRPASSDRRSSNADSMMSGNNPSVGQTRIGQQIDQSNPSCTTPPPVGIYHMGLFGRILGIFPVPIMIDRPALSCIATNMLVHLTSPKLNLKRAYDGRPSVFNNVTEPAVREVQVALAESIYGATTSSVPSAKADNGVGFSMISIKKVVKFLSCLHGGIIDRHWSISPHKVPCVENSAPVPWSDESLNKLLSLLLLRSVPPGSGSQGRCIGQNEDKPSLTRRHSMGLSDAPTRLDVLAIMYETSNHIRELWGEAPSHLVMKKNTTSTEKTLGSHKATLGCRRISSAVLAAMKSDLNLSESDVLTRCMPVRDYIRVAIRAFNNSSGPNGVLWPSESGTEKREGSALSKHGSISMIFSSLSKDPTLSRLSDIHFKTAVRLAGNRIIDLGFAVYICLEAWTAEVKLVERNMAIAASASLRKTAMSLMSLNPDELRPLTLPERQCLSDIVLYYLLGETSDGSPNGSASAGFGERSLSRLASFSVSTGAPDDIFSSVDAVARGINWFLIRNNHRKRLSVNTDENDKSDIEKTDDPFSAAVYLPPDTPALRSLLEFRDVELCHYTMTVAKTVVKRSLWEAHMSDRSGWIDSYNWHPIQLVGSANDALNNLRYHNISFEEVYLSQRSKERSERLIERTASMIADHEADMLDRSDLEAANLVDTSSESEDDEVAPIPTEQSESLLRAMSSMKYRGSRKSKSNRKTMFSKSHPLSYMSTGNDTGNTDWGLDKTVSRSRGGSTDEDSTTINSRYLHTGTWRGKLEAGFITRGRITTADKLRRNRGLIGHQLDSHKDNENNFMSNPGYSSNNGPDNVAGPVLCTPKYLDDKGVWLKWPGSDSIDIHNIINRKLAALSIQPPLENSMTIDHYGTSLWVANDSISADEAGSEMNFPRSDSMKSQRYAEDNGSQEEIAELPSNLDSHMSLLTYFRGHTHDVPRTPIIKEALIDGSSLLKSKSDALLRIQSPISADHSFASRINVGITAYAQQDPYYYFKPEVEDKVKNPPAVGRKAGYETTRSIGSTDNNSSFSLKSQPFTLPTGTTDAKYRFNTNIKDTSLDMKHDLSPRISGAAGNFTASQASLRLEKSSIASALTRLADRTGQSTYMTTDIKKAKERKYSERNKELLALKNAYRNRNLHMSDYTPSSQGKPESITDVVPSDNISSFDSPIVSSSLYKDVVDAWSGERVCTAGAYRKSNILVYGMTDIIGNDASIMTACGALPAVTKINDPTVPNTDDGENMFTTESSAILPVIGSHLAWKLTAECKSILSGRDTSELNVMMRPQSPCYVYDRKTIDFTHWSHPRETEIPVYLPDQDDGELVSRAKCSDRTRPIASRVESLEQLILREAKLTLQEFCTIFKNGLTSSLRRLDLYGSNITKQMANELGTCFGHVCCLEDLCLGRNKLTENVLVPLLNHVAKGGGKNTLKRLDLKDNCELVVNTKPVLASITQFGNIVYLDLSGNRFDSSLESKNKKFRPALQNNLQQLRALSLGCMALGDDGASMVLRAATGHPTLRVLDLANCLVTSAGTEAAILEFIKSINIEPRLENSMLCSVVNEFVLMLHGIIWSAPIVEACPTRQLKQPSIEKGENDLSKKKEAVLKAANEHRVQVIFEGMYDGIDLTV